MASVDGGAHTVAVSFQDHNITRRIGMAGERTCVVYRPSLTTTAKSTISGRVDRRPRCVPLRCERG